MDHIKDFIKLLENLKPSKHSYEVFSDWVIMAAAALYAYKKDESVEQEYLDVAKNYTPDEITKHAELLAITADALEVMESDFLGEVFTKAELTNSRNGQFFTPYHVSYMMASMLIGENLPKNRICRINDPCCGAGGMLVAGAMVLKQRGFNFQRDALFYGCDIDHRCARMTFIQLSLLGIPAIITCGDTLSLKTYWQRETIGCYLSDLDTRLRMEKLVDVVRELEMPKPVQIEEPEILAMGPPESAKKEFFQGELF
jgi:type I restriction-modification system DNA methylase subunit